MRLTFVWWLRRQEAMPSLRVSTTLVLISVSQLLPGVRSEIFTGSLLVNASGQEAEAFAAALATLGSEWRLSESRTGGGDAYSLVQTLCEHLSHGVYALTAQTSGQAQTQTLLSFCRRLSLPCLLISPLPEPGGDDDDEDDDEDDDDDGGVGGSALPISLAPSPTEPLLDLLRYYAWTQFVFLHDGGDSSTLSTLMSASEWEVTALSVESLSLPAVRSLLSAIDWDHRHRRLVIDCRAPATLRALLAQIVAMGKHIRGYNFILTSLDFPALDLASFSHGGANLTALQLLDFSRPQLKEMLETWNRVQPLSVPSPLTSSLTVSSVLTYDSLLLIREALQVLEAQGLSLVARDRERPCLQSRWESGHSLARALRQVQLDGASGRIEFDHRGRRSSFQLQIMELHRGGGASKLGHWSPQERLVVTQVPEPSVAQGKVNRTLVITTIMDSPFFMMKAAHSSLRGNARYEGYVVDLVEELSRLLGFTYLLQPVADGRYGLRDPVTGTWHGMVGEVLYGRADLAVAPLTISYDRAAVLDFTRPFMTVGISLMLKRTLSPGASLSPISPLRYDVWICLMLSLLGVGFLLFVLSRFSPFEGGSPSGGPPTGGLHAGAQSTKVAIGNSLWAAMTLMSQQGSEQQPRAWSVRVLVASWSLFSLLVVAAYTATLTSLLVSQSEKSDIASVQELAEQNRVQYGVVAGGSTQSFFRDSKFSVYSRMWAAMLASRPSAFVRSNAEGVARVRASAGNFAFLLESASNEYAAQRAPCDTARVGRDINQRGYGIALTRGGGPLRDLLDQALLKLNEAGILQQIKRKWWYDKGECGDTVDKKGPHALSLPSLSTHFYLLLAGSALALFIAMVEKCMRPAGASYRASPAGHTLT